MPSPLKSPLATNFETLPVGNARAAGPKEACTQEAHWPPARRGAARLSRHAASAVAAARFIVRMRVSRGASLSSRAAVNGARLVTPGLRGLGRPAANDHP